MYYNKKARLKTGLCVIPPGFEPGTHSLEGCCSIQLSYGTIIIIKFCAKVQKIFYHKKQRSL